MCRVISCAVGRWCLLWPVHSLCKTLLAFALLHFELQGQTCLLLQVSLDFLFLHSNPLWWKGHLFLMLVLEGLKGMVNHSSILASRTPESVWKDYRLGVLFSNRKYFWEKTLIIKGNFWSVMLKQSFILWVTMGKMISISLNVMNCWC